MFVQHILWKIPLGEDSEVYAKATLAAHFCIKSFFNEYGNWWRLNYSHPQAMQSDSSNTLYYFFVISLFPILFLLFFLQSNESKESIRRRSHVQFGSQKENWNTHLIRTKYNEGSCRAYARCMTVSCFHIILNATKILTVFCFVYRPVARTS